MKPIEWLEAWAKARGVQLVPQTDDPWPGVQAWSITIRVEVRVDGRLLDPGEDVNPLALLGASVDVTQVNWRLYLNPDGRCMVRFGDDEWTLTHLVTWLWAHAVDTGRDVRRRCDDCEKGIQWRAGSMSEPSQRWVIDEHGWRCVPVAIDPGLAHHEAGVGCVWWRPCPTCSTKGPPIECSCVVTRRRFGHPGPNPDCRDCDGDGHLTGQPGKPTGYLDTPLARVVCEGAPTEWVQAANGRRGDDALDYLRGIAARKGAEFVNQPEWVREVGGQLQVRMRTPGDPTARTELLRAADALMTPHGRTIDEQSANGVYGYLGEALALWLSGAPCEACKGSGRRAPLTPDSSLDEWVSAVERFRSNPEWPRGKDPCPTCDGHGTALAAYVAQQLALVGEMRPTPAGDSPVDRMDATVAL